MYARGGSVSGCPVQTTKFMMGIGGVAMEESGPRFFGVPIGKRVCVGELVEEARGSDDKLEDI